MSAVYLYAVLGARPGSDCGVGLCAERLRIVVVGDLIAVVGDVPVTPEVTAMTLRTQDAVCRRLATEVDAVLPARFGTVVADDAALTEALMQRRPQLARALGRVAGCEQMTLRVWGESPARSEPAAPEASGEGPGARYLADRLRAQARAQSVPEVEPLRLRLAALIRAEVAERHDRPPLLATVQHLIPRGIGARYLDEVDGARESLRPWRVSATGPWLPYAFAEDAA
jgi:Gas vesicle synthesis protein GvpL/GvpF